MKHAALLLGLSLSLPVSLQAAPLSGGTDGCANPELITQNGLAPTLFTFVNSTATVTLDGQFESLCSVGGHTSIPHDVWFRWMAPLTGIATLSTCGLTTVDTKIAVYDYSGVGPACPTTQALACDDSACFPSLQAKVVFPCTVNNWYVIQIGTSAGPPAPAGGTGQFSIRLAGAPVNDLCTAPLLISGPGPFEFDNTAATTPSANPVSGCSSPVFKDLWFQYTATVTGSLTVSTCNQTTSTSGDTMITLYDNTPCPGTILLCNDNAAPPCVPGSLESSVTIPVTCFDVIKIRLGGSLATDDLVGTFTVSQTGTPCNTPSTSFCVAGGPGALACPCQVPTALPGHGCPSAAYPDGALLSSSGIAGASAATDTLVLTATNIPGPCLFIQSTAQSTTPIYINDGNLCAVGSITRLGIVFPAGGVASFPGGLSPNPIHVAGTTQNLDMRHYQVWYRSIPALCGVGASNLTQALTLVWGP